MATRYAVATGIVVVSLVAGAGAVRDPMTAHPLPARTGHRSLNPPIPRVSTSGVTRSATLVSYCWTERLGDGEERGACADGTPGHPAHTLPWRAGAKVGVDLGLPAHDVQIQAIRIAGGIGGGQSHIVRLDVVGVDPAGRRWTVRIPRRSASDTDLLISAFFADGDVEADLGLRRSNQ